jgi:hypothetical protein
VAAQVARVKAKFDFIEVESPEEEDPDENMFMEQTAYNVAVASMFLDEPRWGQLALAGDFTIRALQRQVEASAKANGSAGGAYRRDGDDDEYVAGNSGEFSSFSRNCSGA